MANVYVTADLHLGHDNIRKYCDRPFLSAAHMNAVLIANWNAKVKPDDVVWHLGDFCFKGSPKDGNGMRVSYPEWREKLTGTLYHVKGNHDGNNGLKYVPDYAVMRYGGKTILFVHNPAVIPVHEGIDLVICGHVHNAWQMRMDRNTDLPVYNAGTDVHDFTPVSIRSVIKRVVAYEKRQRRQRVKADKINDREEPTRGSDEQRDTEAHCERGEVYRGGDDSATEAGA
jgi:calcineurin-like phosphoesterase family protein